jgi:hypothetical protein
MPLTDRASSSSVAEVDSVVAASVSVFFFTPANDAFSCSSAVAVSSSPRSVSAVVSFTCCCERASSTDDCPVCSMPLATDSTAMRI